MDHTVKAYEAELQDLTGKITTLGGMVEHQISRALEALISGNRDLAEDIISKDEEVDALDLQVVEQAILLIAKRQPMGDDLRLIVAAMRVSQDLERIGDLAKNIAKRSLAIEGQNLRKNLVNGVQHLADLALAQLTRAINAFQMRNIQEAEKVCTRDQDIDALYTSLFREMLTYMMEDTRTISMCTHLLFSAKNLERVGDHATNIAEQVMYIVRGEHVIDRIKKDQSSFAVVQ
jgi:phosphate transport system protein